MSAPSVGTALAREEENPAKESKQATAALSHKARRMVMKIQSSSEDLWPVSNSSRKLPGWQGACDAMAV